MGRVKSNLKTILDEKGISVLQLSKDIGYRYESVRQMYIDESKTFPRELLSRICTYLKVTPGDLLSIEKEQSE